MNEKILFVNGSMHTDGETVRLAKSFLKNVPFDTLNLVDCDVEQLKPNQRDDDFKNIIKQMAKVNTIVFGTPVYWSEMSGYLKTLIDRLDNIIYVKHNTATAPLFKKRVYIIVQGGHPSDAIEHITYVFKRVCNSFYMKYEDTILSETADRKALHQ